MATMPADLKSLAHPEWPYAGTAHEWRGFVRDERMKPPRGFTWKHPERLAEESRRIDGIIEIVPIYQKQNFGPDLK